MNKEFTHKEAIIKMISDKDFSYFSDNHPFFSAFPTRTTDKEKTIKELSFRREKMYKNLELKEMKRVENIDMNCGTRRSVYLYGIHTKEPHVIYEISGSIREQNVTKGKSAGGACPVCRLKYTMSVELWEHFNNAYVLPYTKKHTTVFERATGTRKSGAVCRWASENLDDPLKKVSVINPLMEKVYESVVYNYVLKPFEVWAIDNPLETFLIPQDRPDFISLMENKNIDYKLYLEFKEKNQKKAWEDK